MGEPNLYELPATADRRVWIITTMVVMNNFNLNIAQSKCLVPYTLQKSNVRT